MPIILIWNAAALPQAPLVRRLLRDLNIASLALQKGLKKRFDDAERADRLTQDYPVFRFTDEAVSAFVTLNQYGQALRGPTPGWEDRLAGLGRAWNIPRTLRLRVREANLLPQVVAVLRRAVAAIGGSVRRFERPRSDMFNEGAVSAVDLFGMGALAFRSLGAGRAGLYVRLRDFTTAMRAPSAVVPPAGASSGPPLPDLPLGDQIDEVTRYVVGALILLPALSDLMLTLGPDILAGVRHLVLGKLVSYEAQVFDLRTSFFAKMSHGVSAYATAAVDLMLKVRDYALEHLSHWVTFAGAYLDGLFGGVSAFATQFGTFWGGVQTLISTMIGFGTQILAIDLTALVHRTLVAFQYLCDFIIHLVYDVEEKPARYVAPASFPVTLGQLILAEANGVEARRQLAAGASRLRALALGSKAVVLTSVLAAGHYDVNFAGLLGGVERLGGRLNQPVRAVQDQPTLAYSTATEPDLVALIIRPTRDGMALIVSNLATSANTALQETASGLVSMLDTAATTFDTAADRAARSRLGPAFASMAGQADAIAAQTFALETRRPTAFEPLAQQFALAISGGFRAMEGVMGGYLGFVLQEWRTHLAANADTPVEVNATSPRKLLERARLGRVHLPELVMRLPGHPLNADTASLVARRFAAEIRAAYLRGEARLDTWRTPAPIAV